MTANIDPAPSSWAAARPGPPWLEPEILERVDSTNAHLARDPRAWRVVVAERQDQGRGRLGRTWQTTPGTSLAVSALVPAPAGHVGWVSLLTGLAVARAVDEVASLPTSLKWPNDVLAPTDGERKLAGILCEWVPAARPDPLLPHGGVVVGVGVNVASTREELPVETATSLALAGASGVERPALLRAYLTHLARLLTELSRDPQGAHTAYREACGTIGRDVVIHEPTTTRSGTATGVDEEGRLSVTTSEGTYAVSAGDVVHVRPVSG